MSSFRKKFQGGIEKDAPPVASTPQATAAELPPEATDAPKPEPIEAESSPVEEAAKNSLRDRLREMEHAAQLVQQSSTPKPPQYAEPPRQAPQQAPQMPEAVQKFLTEHPRYLTEKVPHLELQLAHEKCGKTWNDADYVESLKRHLGLSNNGYRNGGSVDTENRPRPAPTAPRQQVPTPRVAVSAPPTREAPSYSTGRPVGRAAPLTREELEVAQSCGQTPQEYAETKERLRRQGLIGNGDGR